jgi:Holliday junction resolvase RusA-like endonuclease
LHFVIIGPPRTKKTSNRLVRVRGRHVVLPSKANASWTSAAVPQMQAAAQRHARRLRLSSAFPLVTRVNVRALFYRDANRGDAVGYYQALADALEAAGVVENDRLCVSWDGSRLLVDRERPRVEVTLEPVE